MIHQVTVFFPPPGFKPGKARQWLWIHTRFMTLGHFVGAGRYSIIPQKGLRIRTRQKNKLWVEVSLWKEQPHDRQARTHSPASQLRRRNWRNRK